MDYSKLGLFNIGPNPYPCTHDAQQEQWIRLADIRSIEVCKSGRPSPLPPIAATVTLANGKEFSCDMERLNLGLSDRRAT